MPTVIQAIANQLAEDGLVVAAPDSSDNIFRIYIRRKMILVILFADGMLKIGPLYKHKPQKKNIRRGYLMVDLSNPTELEDAIAFLKKLNG